MGPLWGGTLGVLEGGQPCMLGCSLGRHPDAWVPLGRAPWVSWRGGAHLHAWVLFGGSTQTPGSLWRGGTPDTWDPPDWLGAGGRDKAEVLLTARSLR